MASADLELQGGIVARLRSYAPLTDIVGQKIYDKPPATAQEPYVTIGESDVQRADVSCQQSAEIYITIHAWSLYSGGYMEVKQISDAITEALHHYPMALPTNRLISLDHRQNRTMRDPDGVTSHSVIEFVAFTEKP